MEKRGERERKNSKPNHLRIKTQISENMIALFSRSTRSDLYKGRNKQSRVITLYTVDLNS